MRKMLLSFKADVFERVINGTKIYEHRRVFPIEPVMAYLYVSKPVQAITGIMWLDNKIEISTWIEKYKDDPDAVARITEYLKKHTCAMEIRRFQPTNAISLEQLRRDVKNFVVPQMYYYIEDTELLAYLETNIIETGEAIEHDFSNISSNMICTH